MSCWKKVWGKLKMRVSKKELEKKVIKVKLEKKNMKVKPKKQELKMQASQNSQHRKKNLKKKTRPCTPNDVN